MKAVAWLTGLAALVLAGSAWAQDVTSGPAKGDPVPALKVFDATGAHKDKEVDYAAERKEKPTVYVFIQSDKWTRPVARFVKTLDQAVKKDAEDTYLVAVWLTDKPDETKEYLPRAQQSLQLEMTALTYFPGDKAAGPKDWGVNALADVTVVVANGQKVIATFGYNSINETDVRKVMEALKKARGK